ncbi:MAG: hypothetical protein ABJB22_00615 [Verrucomicrobiota bacterium]
MKRLFEMLVLTRREQRVVIAIVLIVMLVAAVVHYRTVTARQALPRLKTMDPTGEVKTHLTDEVATEPSEHDRKPE